MYLRSSHKFPSKKSTLQTIKRNYRKCHDFACSEKELELLDSSSLRKGNIVTKGEISYHKEKRKMEDMVEYLKGCSEHSFPVGFDRDLLYPPDVVNWNMDNAKAIANEITTSSMLMSTTASSTSPCPKKRKFSSNPNTNNTNNVVVNAPFDSSSFSYDGIINPLKTTISQHPQQKPTGEKKIGNQASILDIDSTTVATTSGDATIAQALQTHIQLTEIFQFSSHIASLAIDAVGPHDVTACYNWILDGGHAMDAGGPIIPQNNCPHVKTHVKVELEDLTMNNVCGHFNETAFPDEEATAPDRNNCSKTVIDKGTGGCPLGENWICVECGVTRCSRYVNGHCKLHWEATKARCNPIINFNKVIGNENNNVEDDRVGHCIAISLEDLSAWCYECNSYVISSDLNLIIKRLEQLKFGENKK